MFSNTTALDIAVGLILVYFIYSLLVSIIGEMFASWLGIRERLLRQGLASILNDRLPSSIYSDFAKWFKDVFIIEPADFKYTTAGRFYQEPTIRVLAKKGDNVWYSIRNTKPSYLSKELYAKTMLNMFYRKGQGVNEKDRVFFSVETNTLHLQPETNRKFREMLYASNGDYALFNTHLEDEFSEMMDRVTGWYKRKIGFILFWLGFFICAILNVDTFQIATILSRNPKVRQDMIKMAQEMVKDDRAGATIVSPDSPTYLTILEQGYGKAFRDAQDAELLLGKGWEIPGKKDWISVKDTVGIGKFLRQSKSFQQKLANLKKYINNIELSGPLFKNKLREYYTMQGEYRMQILDPLERMLGEKIDLIHTFKLDNDQEFLATMRPGIGIQLLYIFGQVLAFWKAKFWGIVVSALALSLGANFWFDLLKKLVAIRSAGVKPEEKPVAQGHVDIVDKPRRNGIYTEIHDPIEKALSKNRKYWESLRGVVAINRAVINSNGVPM
jgi:hypothetical protein